MLHHKYKTLRIPRCRYLSFVIPLCSILVLLLFNSLFFSNACFAIDTSVSLAISTPSLSATGKAGEVVNVSTDIKVDIKNAESYSLILSVDNPNLTNGSTTLTPGDLTTDNTWGYKWDDAPTYAAPTAEGKELTVPNLESNAINFTKTLTFGAKFDSTASAGHYTATGTLSLVATPKQVADLSTITYMQEMTPAICENTPFMDGQNYSKEYILTDNRDYSDSVSKTYTVRKIGTKCWMTQNLRIYNTTIKAEDSDFAGEDIILPNSTVAEFRDNDASRYNYRSYYNANQITDAGVNTTSYYNWYTATVGAGKISITKDNTNINMSICPKGWTLPTGGSASVSNAESTWSDYYRLFRSMGLTISNTSLSPGFNSYTDLDASDLNIVQNGVDANGKLLYNFKYTGRVGDGSLPFGTDVGWWWSSTVDSTNKAYALYISGNIVGPGTDNGYQYNGFAVRCVARGNAEWRMSDATAAGYSTATTLKDSGISTMQEMTPAVCDQVPTPASTATTVPTLRLRDTRDNNDYIIAKYPDGRCWMAENLRIINKDLTSADSDLAEGTEFTVPASNISGFTSADQYESKAYLSTASESDVGITGYYNWYTATAGVGGSSVTMDNQSVDASICPMGWTLPTGGTGTTTDFKEFTTAAAIANSSAGSTKIRDTPYSFKYTGYVNGSLFYDGTDFGGQWWSRAVNSANDAYSLRVISGGINFGTTHSRRYNGFAIRCIARN